MDYAGYAHLIEHTGVQAPMPALKAEVRPVTRREDAPGIIMIPARLAPDTQDTLGHVLFALKYEGVNLCVLSQALKQIPEATMREAFDASPNSRYLRVACYLWEHFCGAQIHRKADKLSQSYTPVFDPEKYYTTTGVRNPRWRVVFNGIGSMDYCVSVRKTEKLEALIELDLMGQAETFTDQLPKDILNRTLAWAYLSETKDSFAIEKEAVNASKSRRFVEVLKKAHTGVTINEDTLVDLQGIAIDNPYRKATSYRNEQNYLGTLQRGVLGVSFVPPEHYLARELMDELCELANNPPEAVDPLILASVVSFGFVFIHPFMDGNGRLSRFLFHQMLCKTGALKNGLVLPVSTAMHQNEGDYLEALKAFSETIPDYWDVEEIFDDQLEFSFTGDDSIYRYWDGTACCEFMAQCAHSAIEKHLKEETIYLNRYDAIYKRINDRFDVASKDLALLVMACMEQKGRVSNNRRKQFANLVQAEVFDELETAYADIITQD